MGKASAVDRTLEDSPDEANRAAGYCRVSTLHQAERGLSLGDQERRLREYIAAHGWTCVGVFVDAGVSGRNALNRPQLQRMLAAAENREFDHLVIPSLDRLGRNIRDVYEILARINAAGVHLVSLRGDVDTSTATGRFLTGTMALAAELESDLNLERVRDNFPATLRKLGYKPGGRRKYGRERDGSIREREARVIRERIVPAVLGGRSEVESARELTENRIPAAQGGAWAASTLASLLRRPDLCGLVRVGDELIEGTLEPIVSRQTWEDVQRVFAARRHGPERRGRAASVDFLLDSPIRIICACCGAPMWRRTGGRRVDGSRQGSYKCSTRERLGPTACPMPPVPREVIDETVLRLSERAILDEEGTLRELERATRELSADTRKALAAADRELLRLQVQLANVNRLFREETITPAEWRNEKSEIEAELSTAEAEAAQLRARAEQVAGKRALAAAGRGLVAQVEEIRRLAEDRRAASGADTLAAIRAALARLVEEIIVVDVPVLADVDNGYLGALGTAGHYVERLDVDENGILNIGVRLHMTGHGSVGLLFLPRRDLFEPVRDSGGVVVPSDPGRAPLSPPDALLTLDLDEPQLAPAAGDQIELVAPGPHVRAEDPPAAQPVPPEGAALGGAAATQPFPPLRSRAPGS